MNILLTTQRMVVLECWRWSVGVGVLVLECWCWIYTTSYARARVSQGLRLLLLLLFCCWVVRIESVGVGSILPPMHVPGFLRQGCVFVVVVVGLGGEIEFGW